MSLITALTVATAATSLGGYASPPAIWADITSHAPVQIAALTILTWQAGRQSLVAAFTIALLFWLFVYVVKIVESKYYVPGTLAARNADHFNPRYVVKSKLAPW